MSICVHLLKLKLFWSAGLSSSHKVDPKYLHPIVRPREKKSITRSGDKELKYVSASGNYMRVPTSPLSPPPDYEKVSRETQTSGYYYYAYDTESATPPPPYLNLIRTPTPPSSPEEDEDEIQSPRPLLYRSPSQSARK